MNFEKQKGWQVRERQNLVDGQMVSAKPVQQTRRSGSLEGELGAGRGDVSRWKAAVKVKEGTSSE